jgi:hypothetical protein
VDTWGAALYGDPCRECGFTWGTDLADMISSMRDLPDAVDQLVARASGAERIPELEWSISGYVAHMTDNTRIWSERLIAVARGADAHVVAYDDNLLAKARRYNHVALEGATWSLRIAVEGWLAAVEEADRAAVVMLHEQRGAMELCDVVASNAHDSCHHRWDLQRILREP